MNIIHHASELHPGTAKVSVAIGVFDGVHLGHQQVIRQTISDAGQHEGISVAITFDQHPNAVVAPDRAPPLIYPLEKKLLVIESLGVDTTLLIHFDKAFSQISAEEFIRGIARDFKNLCSVSVGSTFTFGFKRQGDVNLLRKLGQELNFTVHGLAAVSLDGERVSSTRIRDAIRAGRLDCASQMLGRTYSLTGKVIQGDKIGRKLGFPTANMDATSLALPPTGVYACHVLVGGTTYRAVLNIGYRPTLQNAAPQLRVEAHLLQFEGDLYGQDIAISFVGRLRDEKKFTSPEELKRQIGEDIEAAKGLF